MIKYNTGWTNPDLMQVMVYSITDEEWENLHPESGCGREAMIDYLEGVSKLNSYAHYVLFHRLVEVIVGEK